MLTWVDYVLLTLILLSALLSLKRGFLREAMALLGWVAAVWIVVTFTEPFSVLFTDYISVPSLRLGAAAITLFVATLVASSAIVFLIGKLVDGTGLSGTDRVLGVVFGAGRGVVIVAILVMLAGFTRFPRDPWWKQSVLIPHFEVVAHRLRSLLPANLSVSARSERSSLSPGLSRGEPASPGQAGEPARR